MEGISTRENKEVPGIYVFVEKKIIQISNQQILC